MKCDDGTYDSNKSVGMLLGYGCTNLLNLLTDCYPESVFGTVPCEPISLVLYINITLAFQFKKKIR